jgi:hypothetical protein
LTWTAPSNNGANDVSLQIVGGAVEVFDNGRLVASRWLSRTSSITLTGGLNTVNEFDLGITPAGIPTTINLRTDDDWVNLGGNARSLQNLKGAVTIHGVGGDNGILVNDRADTGQRSALISSSSIIGLAPAPIQYRNINWLNIFSGTGRRSTYSITGSPGEVDFSDYGTGDGVYISSASGRVYASSHAQDYVTFYGPASGSNTFSGAQTWDRMAGSGYSNVAFNFPIVTAYSFSTGDVANLDGASTGVNTFTGNPTSSELSGPGYNILVNGFATVNVTSHSSGDAANLDGASTGCEFIAAIDAAEVGGDLVNGPFTTRAEIFGSGYTIKTSGFTHVTGRSHSTLDQAVLADFNQGYSTDSQGNVFVNDHGFMIAAMGFSAGSVTSDLGRVLN